MSDALTINIKNRRVARVSAPGSKSLYQVFEQQSGGWMPVSKGYEHSTAAYRTLGKLVNGERESLPQGPDTITLPLREVSLHGLGYAVYERKEDQSWERVSKYYEHSTSAYAKLGRIVNAESNAQGKA